MTSSTPRPAGRDLNGDGDNLNGVTVLAPSQTRTYRLGVIAGLRYEINDNHMVRVGYTFDHANHRQTGEVGFLDRDGDPLDVFPINDPIEDSRGNIAPEARPPVLCDPAPGLGRISRLVLRQRLTLNVGCALPFFTRDLDQNCFTTSASGFVDCFGGDAAGGGLCASQSLFGQSDHRRDHRLRPAAASQDQV